MSCGQRGRELRGAGARGAREGRGRNRSARASHRSSPRGPEPRRRPGRSEARTGSRSGRRRATRAPPCGPRPGLGPSLRGLRVGRWGPRASRLLSEHVLWRAARRGQAASPLPSPRGRARRGLLGASPPTPLHTLFPARCATVGLEKGPKAGLVGDPGQNEAFQGRKPKCSEEPQNRDRLRGPGAERGRSASSGLP